MTVPGSGGSLRFVMDLRSRDQLYAARIVLEPLVLEIDEVVASSSAGVKRTAWT